MYLSELWIRNYRCFQSTKIQFEPGVSVIIGENNAGKSSLLSALRLVFEGAGAKSLGRYDFYQGIDNYEEPPRVSITATLSSEGNDAPAELGTVATWLTDVGEGQWEAKVTYHYYLPDDQQDKFQQAVAEVEGALSRSAFWRIVEGVLPRYVARIDAGGPGVDEPGYQRVEPRDMRVFGVQALDAIRDVERDMFSGRQPTLRKMLEEALEPDEAKTKELEDGARELVANLMDRIDDEKLFRLTKETGARDGGAPGIDGELREQDVLRALRLIVDNPGIGKLPITCNGLGYNNLLYISLVLASLDSQSEEKVGSEKAVLFPMLLIEEPEAHLHPALQFKLLRYVNTRIREDGGSRQVFVTTHSTHVTAATGLDAVVSLAASRDGTVTAAYPGRVYDHLPEGEGEESKAYVERFLDATKSTMLFAKGVILVEGISEQLLVPTFAEKLGYSLADEHIAVVAVGGRTFKHFLPIFGAMLEDESIALDRHVACVVDADPGRKKQGATSYSNCHPYQIDRLEEYEYRVRSAVVDTLDQYAAGCRNVQICYGKKTLEYDLAEANPKSDVLVTDHCVHGEHLRTLAADGRVSEVLARKVGDEEHTDLNAIEDDDARRAACYATYYLACVDGKGEHAQALNLKLSQEDDGSFDVPDYIKQAVEWVCQ